MSFSLAGHQIHNGIRNNRAEIASGLVMLPVYAGLITVGIAGALMGVNTSLSGCGNCLPLLETKNRCATSAKVIKAIEQPTEDNVLKAFISQMKKVNNLDVNDSHKAKYEQRLSDVYSSYINKLYPETKNIKSPIMFSIKPESHTSMVHFDKSISDGIKEIIKTKMEEDESHFNNIMPDNKIYLRFDF